MLNGERLAIGPDDALYNIQTFMPTHSAREKLNFDIGIHTDMAYFTQLRNKGI